MNASASPRKRRKKPARKAGLFSWRYLLPAGFFVVLAVFLLLGLGRNPNEIPSPLIGKEAPAFELPRLAGVAAPDTSSISSASLRGKPYLLNVWASWCMPCLQEHPQMMALAQRHRIRMVGMNYKDRPEDARRWLARNGNPFDEIMVDAQGRTAIDFGVYGVPETFLIDGEGRIRRKIVGAISIETLQNELLPAIEKLEAEAK
jgi:periplasmic protein thiol:disulfide oxidoreductase, DsbE subfamily